MTEALIAYLKEVAEKTDPQNHDKVTLEQVIELLARLLAQQVVDVSSES